MLDKINLKDIVKAYIYPILSPTMKWDTGAVYTIVIESGKKVVQYKNGKPVIYNKENLLNPCFIVRGEEGRKQ